ncbi:MAG TPA: hypothetical protein VH040_03170 [Usitatibacter sp.]|nr:hypothetical protein [Usitatibacter sp.]
MSFVAERAVRTHAFVLPLAAARAFPLFEPEGEKAWAEGWQPRYLYPSDGRAEPGMVFATRHGGEETTWLVTRHEPAAGLVEYVRVTPGSRIASVLVHCAALDAARTRVTVIYTFTGLGESGNAYIRAMDDANYAKYIDSWADAIAKL